MNAIVEHKPTPTSSALVPTNMADAMKLAEMMARGKMLPQHLQNSPGDCLMVVEQAMRWGMSPFAVAQCTSSIKGKLMFEGKLVAAAIENSGAISGLLDYEFSGEGINRKIVVSATRRGETKPRTVEVTLKDAQTENPLWKKQPDQQLVYHGARVWGRRWAPGVTLGVYSPEEMDVSQPAFDGTTIEAQAEPIAADPEQPKKPTVAQWLDALELELRAATTTEAVDAITSRPEVQAALDKLRNGALTRLNAMVKAALDATAPPPPATEEDDEDLDRVFGKQTGRVMAG